MKKLSLKKVNHRHYISLAITLGCLAISALVFKASYYRLWEAIKSLGYSIVYYFSELFLIKTNISPTVNELPSSGINVLPDNFNGFKTKLGSFFRQLFNKSNLGRYARSIFNSLYLFCFTATLLMPVIVLLIILFKRGLKKENNDYGKESKPLKAFKRLSTATYVPTKNYVLNFIAFLKCNSYYHKIWLWIWLFNFNVISIIVSFFAYYLYFTVTFDLSTIYIQVYKLFTDLSVAARFIPKWCWVVIAVLVLDYLRKRLAIFYLNILEHRNRAFLKSMPIALFIVGTMGSKKTTLMTDMALSKSAMLRDKMKEELLQNDLKFPSFPWQLFENDIKQKVQDGKIISLYTARKYVDRLERNFILVSTNVNWARAWASYSEKKSHPGLLFGYDYHKYGFYYNDKLKLQSVFDVMRIYAQLYFMYASETSLLISNYSVREDSLFQDKGNFPLWNCDFISRDSLLQALESSYSHILDFDMTRLGKKVAKDNPNANAFEYGAVLITEIGKERENTPGLVGIKKEDKNTNQKNDRFIDALKLIRHPATVDNVPYSALFFDDQRPESLLADGRELAELVHIESSNDQRLALPFFAAEELMHDFIFSRFETYYINRRHNRADTTLFMYAVKTIGAKIHNYYNRIYNRFSFFNCVLSTESGKMKGDKIQHHYYLMPIKIYSNRFNTACFRPFYDKFFEKCKIGLPDMRTFSSLNATFDEMYYENSYFMQGLFDVTDGDKIPDDQPAEEKPKKKTKS